MKCQQLMEVMAVSSKKSAVRYIDANDLEYTVEAGGCKCSNVETLRIELDLECLCPDDTIKVRFRGHIAKLSKGDPVVDADDIAHANLDSYGNVVLSGCGG